jgi:hypothetical protein
MKVIEAMSDDRFERALDAGAELLDALRNVLRSYGLSVDDAPAVLCVAAAGVLSVSPVPHDNFHEMIDMSTAMWHDDGTSTLDGLEFSPPHRQDAVRAAPVVQGN